MAVLKENARKEKRRAVELQLSLETAEVSAQQADQKVRLLEGRDLEQEQDTEVLEEIESTLAATLQKVRADNSAQGRVRLGFNDT